LYNLVFNYIYLSHIGQVKFWLNMASKRFKEIQDNYTFYNKLLEERKSVFSEVLEINKFSNNANTIEETFPVNHPADIEDLILIVDVKINNHNFFQFKLRCKSFFPKPFFRFDSDGDTHWNRIDGIPLEKQCVTTPHFHKYNENGIEIAYKTDKLIDENEKKALEDINLCIIHFFHEANIRVNNDQFPEIKIMSNTLGFTFTKQDPNKNINFL
jgi:hypothetical protein